MKQKHISLRIFLLILFAVAFVGGAQGQATRTWVSGTGDDVNPCSRTAHCKTYAGAISKTATNGEISTLDPGGYGSVTITKSITINGSEGKGYGSVFVPFTNGITINITDPTDVNKAVRLRSLHINGASTGIRGVNIVAANDVHIQNTTIDGFGSEGVNLSTATSTNLHLSDCVIRHTLTAVKVTTSDGFAVASIKNCKFGENSVGLDVGLNGYATINDSVISANGDGLKTSASGAQINATNNVLAHNTGAAVNASVAGSTIRVISNQILSNTTGINAVGTVSSDGQNRNDGNGTNGVPNGVAVNIN